MTHKKIWVDGLDGPVECIGCDCDGRAVALGHGNRVSLADQITICTCFPVHILAKLHEVVCQLHGRTCETFPTLLASQTIQWSYQRPDLFISSAMVEGLLYLSLTTVLCTIRVRLYNASYSSPRRCYDLSALSVIWTIVPRTCNMYVPSLTLGSTPVHPRIVGTQRYQSTKSISSCLTYTMDWIGIPSLIAPSAIPSNV